MSVCAHRQYHYLSKLPRCPKCKSQLTTVFAKYENGVEQWEWECIKCAKVFSLASFHVELDEFEKFLHEKFNNKSSKEKTKRRKHGRKTRR